MKFDEKLYELRKKENLSQEQLADMLHISRQAVGKWESGSAFPDINNMIELSKIFHVSLNELLGVEQEQSKRDSIDLEYLKEWQNTQQRELKKVGKKINRVLIVMGIICLGFVTLFYKQRREINSLRNEMNNQYSSILANINNNYHYTYPEYSPTTSLFGRSDMDVQEMNIEEKTVNIIGKLALKEYSEATTIQLRFIVDEEEYVIDAMYESEGIFTFDEWISMNTKNLSIYAIVDNEGKKQTELVWEYSDFNKYIDYTVTAEDRVVFEYNKGSNEIEVYGDVDVVIELPYWPVDYNVEKVALVIMQNNRIVQSIPATAQQLSPFPPIDDMAVLSYSSFSFLLEFEKFTTNLINPIVFMLNYTFSNGVTYEKEVVSIQVDDKGYPYMMYKDNQDEKVANQF